MPCGKSRTQRSREAGDHCGFRSLGAAALARCPPSEYNAHVPRRTDINNILIIGSGPIVIGQGTEFVYSGTQACKALREEGYSVALINSNPATIMTDDAASPRYQAVCNVQAARAVGERLHAPQCNHDVPVWPAIWLPMHRDTETPPQRP